jgi:hypothetical protein
MDDRVWDVTVFTKNRDRLLEGEVAAAFFEQVIAQAREAGLLLDEHFTVDGTLLEACAGHKSFRPKDGSGGCGESGGERDFHGERRTNDTHASTTDPDARLYKKGAGNKAKLCFLGHAVADSPHGLLVGATTTAATGTAEREAAKAIVERTTRHVGYELSQRKRKAIEQPFGWVKTVGLMRKLRHRGVRKVGWMFTLTVALYDMARMRGLLAEAGT